MNDLTDSDVEFIREASVAELQQELAASEDHEYRKALAGEILRRKAADMEGRWRA